MEVLQIFKIYIFKKWLRRQDITLFTQKKNIYF